MLSFTTPAVTVEEADAYALARAYAGWTGTNDVKAAALRRGQDYIAGQYNGLWTVEFEDDDAPEEVKFAIIEAAKRELATPGFLAPDYIASQQIKRLNKQVGPLKKETEYVGAASAEDIAPVIGIIERLLADYITPKYSPGVMVV